jgi:hypothetical protein
MAGDDSRETIRGDLTIDRRAWLATLLAGCLSRPTRGDEAAPPLRNELKGEAKSVEAIAKRRNLGPVRSNRSANYLAIGDADDAYRAGVLKTCEAHFKEYLEHFRRKGFPLLKPANRLTVVTLCDRYSYAKYVGESLAATSGGAYLPDANRIVVFDQGHFGWESRVPWRVDEDPLDAGLRCLSHEATHQLTFNTGLLNRWGDAPRCIKEGLGMYGELRRLDGRSAIGQLQHERLDDLWSPMRRLGSRWMPLPYLFVADDALEWQKGDTAQRVFDVIHAKTMSWLLVHYLLTDKAMIPRFRAYLAAIYDRKDRSHRLADAEAHLGPLDQLERAVQHYARQSPRVSAFATKAKPRSAAPDR